MTPPAHYRSRRRLRTTFAAAGLSASLATGLASCDAGPRTESNPVSPTTSTAPPTRACLKAQRAALRAVVYPGFGTNLYDSPDQVATAASNRWLQRSVARGKRAVRRACHPIPDAMAEINAAAADRLAAGPYTQPDI